MYMSYADFGRHLGNQTRRHWQNSEHDGLLGSGAFPRPTGYIAPSVAKARGNEHYQLNKSNESYQPPRPYKVYFLILNAGLKIFF